MTRSGPLARSYPGAVALVICALVPFLMLTTAVLPVSSMIAANIGMSPKRFDVVVAMSDAAYAVGSVLAVQLAQHFRQRRLLLMYAIAFAVASALSVWAPTAWIFAAAFIVQGLCTSLMLIAAVPPLVTGWPVGKLPVTVLVMNLCIFGAVSIGPTLGAVQADAHHWRPLFGVVAASSILAVGLVLLTFDDDDPADQEAPWDLFAVLGAAVGCAAAFFGAGYLEGYRVVAARSLVPLCVGTALIVLLVVHQYRTRHPLMPVRRLATAFPVTGILIALFASMSSVGLTSLMLTSLLATQRPGHVAMLFLPEFIAAVVTAGLFAVLFGTRYLPVLALTGIGVVVIAAVLAADVVTGSSDTVTYLTTGLLGLGVGASVSPALFLAGLSLRSREIQRVFALIELLRGVTAFLAAPILAYLAVSVESSPARGAQVGVWVCLGIVAVGAILAAGTFAGSGARLPVPDLERWQEGDDPAWRSPVLFAAIRSATTS